MKKLSLLILVTTLMFSCEDSQESLETIQQVNTDQTYSLTTDERHELFISGENITYLFNNVILATGTINLFENSISVSFETESCNNQNENYIFNGCWFSATIDGFLINLTSEVRRTLSFKNKAVPTDQDTEG